MFSGSSDLLSSQELYGCHCANSDSVSLKFFSAMPTHIMNICAKFHQTPSTK